MSGCGCAMAARNAQERRTLVTVLIINGLMFVVELALGLWAESTGLIADSLDMLADAAVYGISLSAVAGAFRQQVRAARLSGGLQVGLALLVLADVVRRLLYGSEPVSGLMMGVGALALLANIACFRLIARHRDGGVHMRASLIFSKNDVIANAGVILAGALVGWSGSRYPDLGVGCVIGWVVMAGGIQILKEARSASQASC